MSEVKRSMYLKNMRIKLLLLAIVGLYGYYCCVPKGGRLFMQFYLINWYQNGFHENLSVINYSVSFVKKMCFSNYQHNIHSAPAAAGIKTLSHRQFHWVTNFGGHAGRDTLNLELEQIKGLTVLRVFWVLPVRSWECGRRGCLPSARCAISAGGQGSSRPGWPGRCHSVGCHCL